MKKRIFSLLLAVVIIVGMIPLSVITASAAAEIPTSYSSKEKGYTTEVKNQFNTSCSWAYAATSMMETFLKKNNMYEGALSPLHMAYAQSSDSDAGWVARKNFLTSGGDSTMAIGFCTSPIGFRESYLEDLEVMDISKEITSELEVRYREIAKQFDENSEKKFVVDESGHCICGMTHIHSFSTDWQHDETGHWHVCTAEGCTIKDYATCGIEDAAYGEHVFDESGHCICGMSHIHSFSTDWQHDETGHWHACTAEDCTIKDYATCGIEDAAYGEHAFDESGHCICGISNIHSFSTDWQYNETGHWHICTANDCYIKDYATCGIEDAAYGEHTYVDGKCTVCKKEQSPEGAKNDAVRVIQNTVDHSEDAVLKLLEKNAVDAIQSAGTVAEVIVARNYWLTAINKQLGTLTHTHTFADGFTYNELVHWSVCTCEDEKCKNLVDGFATHTFTVVTNDDGSKTYTCTVCDYTKTVYEGGSTEGEPVQGVVKCDGISLTLSSDIHINFYMQLTDEALANGKMVFTIGNRKVEGVTAQLNESNGRYYFACPLNALEMAETVTATFTYGSTTYTQTYSVKQYIETILNGKDKQGNAYSDEMKLLARKIANYGYYAQLYLASIHSSVKIGTDGYAQMLYFNQDDIDVDKAKELQDNFTATANTANLTFDGRTVYFDSATALNFYVIAKNGLTAADVTCDKGKNVEVKLYSGNTYIVSVKDITATELAEQFTVTISVGGEKMTIIGSVLDYCAAVINAHNVDNPTAKDTLAINAMAAFYEYYDAAVDYAKSVQTVYYDVTFDMDAHGEDITVQVKSGEKAEIPANPAADGYFFDGWYADEYRTIPWNFNTPITEDTTIYAKWIDKQELQNAAIAEIDAKSSGTERTIGVLAWLEDADKTSYIDDVKMAACKAKEAIENAESINEIAYAKDRAENEIAALESMAQAENDKIEAESKEDAKHEVEVFATQRKETISEMSWLDEWDKDDYCGQISNLVDSAKTAIDAAGFKYEIGVAVNNAKDEIIEVAVKAGRVYGVRFEMMGHGEQEVPSQIVKPGGKVQEPEKPVEENYFFDGWYKDEGFQVPWSFNTDTVNAGITLYAKWLKFHTVTFDMMGHGEYKPPIKIVDGLLLPEIEPEATGYEFEGWYRDQNLTEKWDFDTDTVTGDITLYAEWTPKQ